MFIIEGVCGHRRKGLDRKQRKHLRGVLRKQIVGTNNQKTSRVVYIIKLKLSHTLLSTTSVQLFSNGGGFVFSVTPFFPWGRGGSLKAANSGGGDGGVTRGAVSREEFDVDNGGGGGGLM